MVVELDRKELVKYPFLKESQEIVRRHIDSIDQFLAGPEGPDALLRAEERVLDALASRRDVSGDDVHRHRPEVEIASYALARMLVSCIGDRVLIERLCRYEAERALWFLRSGSAEDHQKKREYVARSVGISLESDRMPVPTYVELVSRMRDSGWRLVNREVESGFVLLEPRELDDLLRERIRIVLQRQLPLRVPAALCERFAEAAARISASYQQQMLEQFGRVEEDAFPPCIAGLIRAITAGTNLPHMGRFAITAFLHTIGMNATEIVELYSRAPDFDLGKTMYQVEHISGRGGTEYTPPSCATMRTFGLCIGRDGLCEHVSHPLSYYRKKKSEKPKKN
ncbi:dna primase large subunit [hydrocarbon metagenome]|uniref:Dna primase large subunit n=1 Tax=hydrocarbon metagenome TaxID=938273 RepID=A0A0W8FK85_9ZZZZ